MLELKLGLGNMGDHKNVANMIVAHSVFVSFDKSLIFIFVYDTIHKQRDISVSSQSDMSKPQPNHNST